MCLGCLPLIANFQSLHFCGSKYLPLLLLHNVSHLRYKIGQIGWFTVFHLEVNIENVKIFTNATA